MPALVEDPYPWYRELREHDPVHYSPSLDAWFVARYDDVLRVLRVARGVLVVGDPHASGEIRARSAARPGGNRAAGVHGREPDTSRFLLTADPPRPHQAAPHGEPAVHAVGHRRARALVRTVTERARRRSHRRVGPRRSRPHRAPRWPAPAPRDRAHARHRRRARGRLPRVVGRDDPRLARRVRPHDATAG